ncbi:hypothetical protein KIW84_050007 [Lathyrus oleraceus]|uniref:Uncharacterized protein n=1 Tax=Pisum sativum TaxID=3888 RepID=A0A9D4WIH2_PEA|nr:hypothetical protein KIW84_050007 [Pisum sativum]
MASKLKGKAGTAGKGKEKASSSSMDVQHFFKDHTPEELERYQKFYQKKIVQTPKFGDLSSFPVECFNFQDKLISIGKKITLTPKRLGQILDIPSGGHMLYDPEDEVWSDYNKREFYFGSSRISESEYHVKRVESHGGEEPPKDFWSAGNFFINDRLLPYFLAYVIFPRNSNHCTITDMDMQALYAIKNDISLNWSRLILHHLMTHNNKFKSLPYACSSLVLWNILMLTLVMLSFVLWIQEVTKSLSRMWTSGWAIGIIQKQSRLCLLVGIMKKMKRYLKKALVVKMYLLQMLLLQVV